MTPSYWAERASQLIDGPFSLGATRSLGVATSNLYRESEGTLLKCATPLASVNENTSARARPGAAATAKIKTAIDHGDIARLYSNRQGLEGRKTP